MKIIGELGKIVIRSGIDEEGREAITVEQTGNLAESYTLELGALEIAKDILQREHNRQVDE